MNSQYTFSHCPMTVLTQTWYYMAPVLKNSTYFFETLRFRIAAPFQNFKRDEEYLLIKTAGIMHRVLLMTADLYLFISGSGPGPGMSEKSLPKTKTVKQMSQE